MDILTPYLRRFHHVIRKLDEKTLECYDTIFFPSIWNEIEQMLRDEGIKGEALEKARELLYKVLLVKGSFDMRYDNILIHAIIQRVTK